MKKLTQLGLFISLSCFISTAYGQLGFLKKAQQELTGSGPSSDETVLSDSPIEEQDLSLLLLQQEDVVMHYVLALTELGNAQVNMLDALGEKEKAVEYRDYLNVFSTADILDKQRLNEGVNFSNSSNDAISEALKQNKELSEESALLFTTAFIHYGVGADQTVKAVEEIKPFLASVSGSLSNAATSAGSGSLITNLGSIAEAGSAAGKFAVTFYLVQATPKLAKGHHDTISQLIAYANTNAIELPTDGATILETLSSGLSIEGLEVSAESGSSGSGIGGAIKRLGIKKPFGL